MTFDLRGCYSSSVTESRCLFTRISSHINEHHAGGDCDQVQTKSIISHNANAQ